METHYPAVWPKSLPPEPHVEMQVRLGMFSGGTGPLPAPITFRRTREHFLALVLQPGERSDLLGRVEVYRVPQSLIDTGLITIDGILEWIQRAPVTEPVISMHPSELQRLDVGYSYADSECLCTHLWEAHAKGSGTT